MNELTVNDLRFQTDCIYDHNIYNADMTEYVMMCSTTNQGYNKLAKDFEADECLFDGNLYFGIIRNETTKRFQLKSCRLFYINNDGDILVIDNDLKSEDYKKAIDKIKEYVRLNY